MRVWAARVAAVRVRSPQQVCAPWRASSSWSVISLKVVGDDLPQDRWHAVALSLGRRQEHGGAAAGLTCGEGQLVCPDRSGVVIWAASQLGRQYVEVTANRG